MRAKEIISEAYRDPEIKEILTNKGYKYLGGGVDQSVYLEPGTGLILKIFGTSAGSSGSATELTNAQKSFKTFYDLSKADPNNPFLPNIIEYEPFMFKGKPYLQIRMERLFEFKGSEVADWRYLLADIAEKIDNGEIKTADTYIRKLKDRMSKYGDYFEYPNTDELVVHLGGAGLKKLVNTIILLKKVAVKNDYGLDLHRGNFMLGSDGNPVISDPFFMGWGKSVGNNDENSYSNSNNSSATWGTMKNADSSDNYGSTNSDDDYIPMSDRSK